MWIYWTTEKAFGSREEKKSQFVLIQKRGLTLYVYYRPEF